MDARTINRILEQLSSRIAELEKQLAGVPTRWAAPPPAPLGASIVKVTGVTNAGGVYGILRASGNPTGLEAAIDGSSTTFSLPQGMTLDSTDQPGELLVLDENTLHGHRLATGSFAVALKIGNLDPKHQRASVYAMLAGVGSRSTPVTLLNTGVSGDASMPDSTPWSFDSDGKAVTMTVEMRTYWDATAGVLYGFSRNWSFDALGKLYQVTGETRYIIDTPGPCS